MNVGLDSEGVTASLQAKGQQEALKSSSLSVVVAVFNSETILPVLIERLEPVLASLSSRYEVIFVNDASRDGSWKVIQALCETRSWVRGIDLMRNYGQHIALLCGIRAARFEMILTMDDDLQNPPEEIHKLLSKLREGFDVVYGAVPSGRQGLWRQLASRITRLILRRAMQVQAANQVSAFRAIRAPVCQVFSNHRSPFVSIDVLLSWSTSRFSAVAVEQHERQSGESNYTLGKLVMHAVTMMTGFSTLPLRLASLLGFAFTAFGIALLTFVVVRYLLGGILPGFTFLAAAIALFSGVQLFALGIIGEYLARLYSRMMDRPVYVVAATAGSTALPYAQP